jgi:hypothetical protein
MAAVAEPRVPKALRGGGATVGTHITVTEQGVYYLEGDHEKILHSHEQGTPYGPDRLADYLAN